MTEVQSKWQDKTRGGYPVRIYNEDADIFHHIHGAMAAIGTEQYDCESWLADGHYFATEDSVYDLMPIPKKKRVYKTLNELARTYGIIGISNGRVYIAELQSTCHMDVLEFCEVDLGSSEAFLEAFTKEVDDV